MNMKPEEIIEKAREMYGSTEVEIDNSPILSVCDEGAWVQAWVWVPKEDEDA